MSSVSVLVSDISNLSVAIARQFAANMATLVSLTTVSATAQTRDYVGVVQDMTSGTASFVPFVAQDSNLNPGWTPSTLVTLHTDKAEATLDAAVTNSVGLIADSPDPQTPPITGEGDD